MTATSGPISYGTLTAADAERCARLERILFPGDGPWPAAAFRDETRSPHNLCLAARDTDGTLVGYAILARLGPTCDPEFEVHTIGVAPGHQGRGIGRALLRAMLAEADAAGGPVFLDVRTDNAPAIGLYRAHGFETIGVRRGYYRPSGADADLMRREPRPREDPTP